MSKSLYNKRLRNTTLSKTGFWISLFFISFLVLYTIGLYYRPFIQHISFDLFGRYIAPDFKKEGELSFYDKNTNNILKTIDIEITDNKNELLHGLMYRNNMSDSVGMFFIMPKYEKQSFWMKNTYIPLDVIFLDENLNIVTIVKDTEPRTLDPIRSRHKALYVVEVAAGFCVKYNISVDDYISVARNSEKNK